MEYVKPVVVDQLTLLILDLSTFARYELFNFRKVRLFLPYGC